MIALYSIYLRRDKEDLRYSSPRWQTFSCVAVNQVLLVSERKEVCMLWTIFVMLLILWFLGLISSYTLGGYIHLLLVVALVVLLVNLLTGRRGAA